MADQSVDEALQKADRWSKVIALGVAIAGYVVASQVTANPQFNATIAAFGGIGVRIYVPYHVSVFGSISEKVPSQAHSETGNYHHGAVGAGLIVGSTSALVVMAVLTEYYAALVAGVVIATGTFLALRAYLPGK
ncbi:hypothetical protein [Halorhabdus rudnickae]|uniref:hypothetical protein n=1 Tax=Halorhabdus rudnickae TaxID=1775544 RepID=UPI0010848B00|nr:hypothetical protein [Halorhabdus rudnickae]